MVGAPTPARAEPAHPDPGTAGEGQPEASGLPAGPTALPRHVDVPDTLVEHAPELVDDPHFKRFYQLVARVAIAVFHQGFTHAGNLAYLTLIAMFPFFIAVAALADLIGRDQDTMYAIDSVLEALPDHVQTAVRLPLISVVHARSGTVLWLGGIVALWTVASLIEAIRDMLRSAYGSVASAAFWQYRLASMGVIIASIVLMLMALSIQLMVSGFENLVLAFLPSQYAPRGWLLITHIIQAAIVFLALYFVIFTLTPSGYRSGPFPKWPGALFTALWWQLGLVGLPFFYNHIASYGLTYGSLAGVIITLLFFWFVGLGLVIGGYLNAALVSPQALAEVRARNRAKIAVDNTQTLKGRTE